MQIGLPGSYDPHTDTIRHIDVPGWGRPGLVAELARRLSTTVAVENDVPNNWAAMCCLKRYRMWRRQGAESRWVTEGQTLALKNTAMLIVRGRFGGRLVDSNALVTMRDLPA